MLRNVAHCLTTLCFLTLLSSSALASGLIVDLGDGPPTLVPLSGLSVTTDLNDVSATTEETRNYSWATFQVPDAAEIRFVRSFFTAQGSVQSATVNGEPLPGKFIVGDEALKLRQQWATDLGEAAPLRNIAGGLWVSEPIDPMLFLNGFGQFTIHIVSVEPLSPHGSLRGVSIPTDWNPQPVGSVTLNATATSELPVRTLFAPYHSLTTVRTDTFQVGGNYSGYSRCTSFDVTVLMSTGNDPIHLDLLAFRYNDIEEGHFMALISPDPNPTANQIVPRDLVLVMDRSGSMGGEKMAQAKAALKEVLSGLTPQDSFSLIAFDDKIDNFRPEAQLATPANIEMAIAFVDKQKPDGSTNIHDALKTALLQLPSQSDHPRYVVFLTDGMPTAGVTDIDEILEMAAAYNEVNARIFTFGIGGDVNTVLLDKLAAQSNGDALYVLSEQGVALLVTSFFAQITAPVLADPVLTLDGVAISHVYPEVLSDLFADQTAVVLGKYKAGGEAVLSISGKVGNQVSTTKFTINMPKFSIDDGFVPRIWAKRHVGTVLQQVKLGDTDPALVAEATEIARRYGVVTEFTYFEVTKDGDAIMTYSAVPNAAVGEDAVSTSSSLDSYQKGGGVEGDSDSFVRYALDRTFPRQGGYFVDTSLSESPNFVNITFASDTYWNLLAAEADLGISDLLAIAPDVMFEFLGRNFRVSAMGEETPPETTTIPPAQGVVTADLAVVTEVVIETGGDPIQGEEINGINPEPTVPGAVPTTGVVVNDDESAKEPLAMGCATRSNPTWPVLLWGFMIVVVWAVRGNGRNGRNGLDSLDGP